MYIYKYVYIYIVLGKNDKKMIQLILISIAKVCDII